MSYRDEIYIQSNKRTDELLKEMPEFSKKFFISLNQKGFSPQTIQQYAYDLNKFFNWISDGAFFRGRELKFLPSWQVLDKLALDDIQEYLKTLDTYEYTDTSGRKRTHRTSAASKARKISSLRAFFAFYYKIGETKNALHDLIEVPKIPEKEIIVLDNSHIQRLLSAVDDITGMNANELAKHNKVALRDKAIVSLFLGCGIRVSELVGLDLNDIDFYKYQNNETKGSIIVTRKGGNEDQVFFSSEVKQALQEYINHCRPTLLGGNTTEDALFVSLQHKRLTTRSVEVLIKKYAQKACINIKCTPHTLRRSYGTSLYEQSGDIYLVADSLGHASVETTKKHYAKISSKHKELAAKYSSALFKKD